MMKLSHFFFLILIPVLYSCSSDEHYLDFTIEKQDIKIAKAFWGRIKILSGNMDYSINNLNSDIAEAYIYEDGEYGNIVIKPIQKGKATIEITDNICHTSIIIKAEVVDNEIGTIIRESNHPLLKEGGFLWFKEDEKRSFRITVQDVDIAKGLYSIYKSEKKYYLSLASKNDDGNEATEVYDIGESDYVALYMLNTVLNLGLFETTRSAPPPKAHWLRMKGINNEYNINCIASTDEGYDIEGETR